MKMLHLLTLVLLAYARMASPESGLAHPTSIFILSGQSNMSGRGGVGRVKWDGIVPPECTSSPSILRLGPKLTWEEAEEPLHADIDLNKTLGVGPGMSFAHTVLAQEPSLGPIGLVPCAIGGTNITEWARGGLLYGDMVRRAKAAVNHGGTIRAILWYQGESDTIIKEDALRYKQRLVKFIQDVRSDLKLPTLPFIQVGLATALGPYIDIVRAAQFGVKLPNVKIVDAKGLPLEWDNVHLNTPAEVKLGQMLAHSFLHDF
ncbi:Sialate O-acetylesterase domain [Dillenia turbinata]|uniref:Sialate O-acetylesterase domain n=1 Tax=Dillenia turbinata TaxID=194707 RepID=A0AAN8VRD5_9MAGN